MNRRHITPSTPRLNYNPQKKSHNPKRNLGQPRWRPPLDTNAQRCTRSKHYVIDQIERGQSTSFTLYSPFLPLHHHELSPSDGHVVPSLSHLCQRRITMSEQSYRAELGRLLNEDYLPTEMRNGINSTALARGYLATEREMKRLLLHADMEELDFSHPNCRELVNDAFLRQFFPHAPIIKEVDSWEEITSAVLYRSPQGCPRLLRLSLATCWNISSQLIKDLLKSYAHLSVLDLSCLPVELVSGIRFESPTLTQLILARIRGTRPSFPLSFALAAPSLRLLSLRDTPYVGHIAIAAFADASRVSGSDTWCSRGVLLKRAAADSLHDVTAGRLHALDMCGVNLFASQGSNAPNSLLELCLHNATTLKVLNLAHCDVKPFLLGSVRALPDLRLEEVSLARNKNLSSEAIVEFVRAFSNSLRLLDISGCDVHTAHISAVAQSLQPTPNFITIRT